MSNNKRNMTQKKKKIQKFKNQDGVEYSVIWLSPAKREKAEGLCDNPEEKKPKIWIDPNLKERRRLSVLIEEVVHAHFFEKPEYAVRKLAANLSKLIIKNEYRLKN